MTTGEKIKYYRTQCGQTRKQAIANTNLSIKQLVKIETNLRSATPTEIKQLAKNFNIKSDLLKEDKIPKEKALDEMTIGEKIEFYRQQQNITATALSKKSGVSSYNIYAYEKNAVANIKYEVIKKIADALNVPIQNFVTIPKEKTLDEMTIGEKIEFYRKSINLSRTQLAEQTGIRIAEIRRYEKNERTPPFATVQLIAKCLNIPISKIYKLYCSPNPYHNITEILYIDCSISVRIRYYREEQNVSLYDLCEKTNLNYNTLINYEKNTQKPNIAKINKIAQALNVDAIQILDLATIYNNKKLTSATTRKSIMDNMTFQQKVTYYRRLKGMSQQEFVNKLNRKQSTCANYEIKNTGIPYIENLNLIAKCLNVSVKDLVYLYVANTPYQPPRECYEKNNLTGDIEVRYIEQPYILPNMTIGERAKYYRKQQGLSQEDIGKKAGVTFPSVSKFERSGYHHHHLSVINRYAKALGVDAAQLYEFYEVNL